ncbi:CGNR zinc finger domain-containing protein [Plantactinospora sp. S1510]|uniref:CGNR zinc finger domain-containing protein n=1 Tax=Plantactinospora alkalitolerans TaxID=2789879 RepID=A0ABS0GWZ6_9ACTN|nr:CGNR zinc finger domain-containing protein [Plantactinospora alkalitolerans]MBF9130731.1 CGNR zinc finger domain-containing protein [Plantactinospora alkalitolerans]
MTIEDADARRPAPGRLRLVQDFCNSVDFEGGWDDLAEVDSLVTWLNANGHPTDVRETGDAEVRRALRFREALRDLLSVPAIPGQPGSAAPEPYADRRARGRIALAEAAAGLPLIVVVGETITLAPARAGLPGALAAILAALALGTADGTLSRLKVCQADSCRWVFYDQSRNGSSRWCTMRLCGARNKNRSYRRRLREATE